MARDFRAEVENNFSYHRVSPEIAAKMAELRAKFKALAHEILDVCPETRERTLGVTHLEEAMMWTIGSLARQAPPTDPPPLSGSSMRDLALWNQENNTIEPKVD